MTLSLPPASDLPSNDLAILKLRADLRLAVGANRACYVHPENPGLCIKVDKPLGQGRNNSRFKRLRRMAMPWLPDISSNVEEAKFYRSQVERIGEVFYRHAPRWLGSVATDQGPGLVFEIIRDSNGMASQRLDLLLREQPALRDPVLTLVDELYDHLQANSIRLFDPNLHNLLLQRREGHADRLVVIDWKGACTNREIIPLSSMIPALGRRKMRLRFDRMRQAIREHAAAAALAMLPQ